MRQQETVSRDVQKELDSAARRKESRWREQEKKREAEGRGSVKSLKPDRPSGNGKRGTRFMGACELCHAEGPVVQTEEGDFCDDCVGKVSSWVQ